MVPGFFSGGVLPIEVEDYTTPGRYTAKVLQLYFETILEICSLQEVKLLNYKELPNEIWPLFNRQMQIRWPQEKVDEMKSRALFQR